MTITLNRALDLAQQSGWSELVQVIEQHPELATAEDASGRTLLQVCAGMPGSAQLLRRLVRAGADPNHRSWDGSTALAAAIVGGSRHGLTTLSELSALLDLGADPEQVVDAGMPALHWAIAQHRPEHARVLLERGARVGALTDDDPPESPVDIAKRMASVELLALLAEFSRAQVDDSG